MEKIESLSTGNKILIDFWNWCKYHDERYFSIKEFVIFLAISKPIRFAVLRDLKYIYYMYLAPMGIELFEYPRLNIFKSLINQSE